MVSRSDPPHVFLLKRVSNPVQTHRLYSDQRAIANPVSIRKLKLVITKNISQEPR